MLGWKMSLDYLNLKCRRFLARLGLLRYTSYWIHHETF